MADLFRNTKMSKRINDRFSDRLNAFTANTLAFKQSPEEVKAIKDSVFKMIDTILDHVTLLDKRFEILRTIQVGSMAEGTRIMKPDEFDILIVLKQLSQPGTIQLKRECERSKAFAHIYITDDRRLGDWEECCQNNKLFSSYNGISMCRPFNGGCKRGIKEMFHTLVKNVVTTLTKEHMSVKSDFGELSLFEEDVEIHGPAVTPTFEWKSKCLTGEPWQISVDLVLAIEVDGVEQVVDVNDTYRPEFFDILKQTSKFHMIPSGKLDTCKDGYCFQVKFTEAEVKLMQKQDECHIKCYKILKYLLTSYFDNDFIKPFFMSYALKTILLRHSVECTKADIGDCVTEIINSMLYMFIAGRRVQLTTVFFNDYVIYNEFAHTNWSFDKTRKMLLNIKSSLDNVRETDATESSVLRTWQTSDRSKYKWAKRQLWRMKLFLIFSAYIAYYFNITSSTCRVMDKPSPILTTEYHYKFLRQQSVDATCAPMDQTSSNITTEHPDPFYGQLLACACLTTLPFLLCILLKWYCMIMNAFPFPLEWMASFYCILPLFICLSISASFYFIRDCILV